MDPIVGAAAIQAGAQVGGGLLTMLGQKKREARAVENQQKLMGLQMRNQMALNEQGQKIQQETWEKTNYPAQMKMLQEAGLNPALLYSKGGSGGVTGSQGGGSASGGNAPAPQPMPNMDIGNAVRTAAETLLAKAQARKLNAEAGVIETYGGKQAETGLAEAGYRMNQIAAVTENEKAKNALIQAETEWQNIQNGIANKTADELIKGVMLNNQRLSAEIKKGMADAKVAEATIDQAIKQVELTTVEQSVRILLEKQGILKAEAETEEIKTRRQAIITQIAQTWTSLGLEDRKIKVSELLSTFNTTLPMKIGQWTGMIGNILSGAKQATTVMPGGPLTITGFGH